jgi:hypothetical protein
LRKLLFASMSYLHLKLLLSEINLKGMLVRKIRLTRTRDFSFSP